MGRWPAHRAAGAVQQKREVVSNDSPGVELGAHAIPGGGQSLHPRRTPNGNHGVAERRSKREHRGSDMRASGSRSQGRQQTALSVALG